MRALAGAIMEWSIPLAPSHKGVRISAAAILSVFVHLGGMTIGLYDSVSRRTTGSGKPLRWLLLVLLCAVLFSGCDRHVRVTKEMAWECDPGKTSIPLSPKPSRTYPRPRQREALFPHSSPAILIHSVHRHNPVCFLGTRLQPASGRACRRLKWAAMPLQGGP